MMLISQKNGQHMQFQPRLHYLLNQVQAVGRDRYTALTELCPGPHFGTRAA